ncbi:MAG TPA: hypothetical protein VMU98_07565 [Acidimicrobiales bacterium]|nr:hypothetical protein [Acidimicrobiales bacterium]
MILALKVLAVVALVLLSGIVVLRVRKVRRDQTRELSRSVERRLVSPPPSPYAPSKGFRLLDGQDPGSVRPAPARPRLDPQRNYVFSDTSPQGHDDVIPTMSRHDQEWLLQRSSSRSTLFGVGSVALIILVVVFVVAAVVLYDHRHPGTKPPVGSTTTTTSTSTTTTTSTTSTTGANSLGVGATHYFAFAGPRLSIG